jgi:hypothetical protein
MSAVIISAFIIGGILVYSTLNSGGTSTIQPNCPARTSPTFVWLFGYEGKLGFMPSYQLGLSQTDVLSAVSKVSNTVGARNLILVRVVDESDGSVSPKNYSGVQAFVSQLKSYAIGVWGRISLQKFNMTSTPSIFDEVSRMIGVFGLNGVWFDGAPSYYSTIGSKTFGGMMETLAKIYPNDTWGLNQSGSPVLAPQAGADWPSVTYVFPSVAYGSTGSISTSRVAALMGYFGSNVVMHLDADVTDPKEPMSLFADLGSQAEANDLLTLVQEANAGGYHFLYPLFGGATSATSQYRGSIYNSLSTGTYARGTFPSMLNIMQACG